MGHLPDPKDTDVMAYLQIQVEKARRPAVAKEMAKLNWPDPQNTRASVHFASVTDNKDYPLLVGVRARTKRDLDGLVAAIKALIARSPVPDKSEAEDDSSPDTDRVSISEDEVVVNMVEETYTEGDKPPPNPHP